MVAFVGMLPGAPVVVDGPLVVVVPALGGYLIPLEGHEPALGALMGTNEPSMTEPFKLKYQLIALSDPDVQSRAGMYPD